MERMLTRGGRSGYNMCDRRCRSCPLTPQEESMPRGATRRRATEADLDDTQREIYNALPDHLREQYMRGLPMISISTAGNRKKAQLIRERITLLDSIIGDLQNHRKELFTLARSL